MNDSLVLQRIHGIPEVHPGDDLPALVLAALDATPLALEDGDVVLLAQKIVSKAEGRLVRLADVTPGAEAIALAAEVEKDPRLVQLILDESTEVVRRRPGVMIMRHKLGFVQAHAGIDQSNVDHSGGETALLLPENPDASAAAIREALQSRTGRRLAVVIIDSMNRPWRLGTIGTAIGSAGFQVLDDLRGGTDSFGRELVVSMVSRVDSLAASAALLMGEAAEGTPLVIARGLDEGRSEMRVADVIRPLEEDLFR